MSGTGEDEEEKRRVEEKEEEEDIIEEGLAIAGAACMPIGDIPGLSLRGRFYLRGTGWIPSIQPCYSSISQSYHRDDRYIVTTLSLANIPLSYP